MGTLLKLKFFARFITAFDDLHLVLIVIFARSDSAWHHATLKARIIAKAEYAKALLKEMLQQSQYDVCLSMDRWTNAKLESFIGVTCHFFLDDKTSDATLHFGQFDAQATADKLADGLGKVIRSYGLEGRIGPFMVDNGQNVVNAIRRLGIEPTRCAAHVLNIAVKDGFGAL